MTNPHNISTKLVNQSLIVMAQQLPDTFTPQDALEMIKISKTTAFQYLSHLFPEKSLNNLIHTHTNMCIKYLRDRLSFTQRQICIIQDINTVLYQYNESNITLTQDEHRLCVMDNPVLTKNYLGDVLSPVNKQILKLLTSWKEPNQ